MLYGWMKSLIIYLIFAGAIINLSPSGSYKKYIRLFTGLIAIIILMKPISYIFNFDESKLYNALGNVGKSEYQIDELDSEVADYYDLSLNEGIKLELNDRGFMVEEVSVINNQDNELLSCTVYVSSSQDMDPDFAENNIKSYINEVYNLDVANIYVLRR